jgi:hypothetical protein
MHQTSPLELDYPPLMLRQLDALRVYAAEHGSRWKQHLRTEWIAATGNPLLSHLRQTHGSMWLEKFQLPH